MNNKFQKKLYNEISLILSVLALIGLVIGGVLFVRKPDVQMERDIALISQKIERIETNDMPHIYDDLKEIKDDIVEIKLNIQTILTILSQ